MAQIILQFVRNASPMSRLIRWWEWGDWSHVQAEFPSGDVLDVRWPRAVIGTPMFGPRDVVQRVALTCTQAQRTAFYDGERAKEGCGYDWTPYAGFVVRRDWRVSGRWFCSEAIQYDTEQAGCAILRAERMNRVMPWHLATCRDFTML